MIRKISIGSDYKDAMHFTVGQSFGHQTIEAIKKVAPNCYEVWVRNERNEILLWKEFENMPNVRERDTKAYG